MSDDNWGDATITSYIIFQVAIFIAIVWFPLNTHLSIVEGLIAITLLQIVLLFITQVWFLAIAFSIGALAAGFATLASIIRFEILYALGYFFLMCLSGFFAWATWEDVLCPELAGEPWLPPWWPRWP